MSKKRLQELLRAAERKRDRKIHVTTRPWLDLPRLYRKPCNLPGITCEKVRFHSGQYDEGIRQTHFPSNSWKMVGMALLVSGVDLLAFFVVALFAADSPQAVFPWMSHHVGWFLGVWPVTVFVQAQLYNKREWDEHTDELAQLRKRLEAVTLGVLFTDELNDQVAAIGRRLYEDKAGLNYWERQLADRLSELPKTEVIRKELPTRGEPFRDACQVTDVQVPPDQVELHVLASEYGMLRARIVEALLLAPRLAKILGENLDRREVLRARKGTDFNPEEHVVKIEEEIERRLEELFTELSELMEEVSLLNTRAAEVLADSELSKIKTDLTYVRLDKGVSAGADDHHPGQASALQERRGK